MSFIRRWLWSLSANLPQKVIRGPGGQPILERYHLWGRPQRFGVVLHRFVRSDPGRGGHDHPWAWGVSLILSGAYQERIVPADPAAPVRIRSFRPGMLNWHITCPFACGRLGSRYHRFEWDCLFLRLRTRSVGIRLLSGAMEE